MLTPTTSQSIFLGFARACRVVLVSLACSLGSRAADPYLSLRERAEVLQDLDESRREFLASIDGVSEQQWSWKPAPKSWSIGETAEHIVLAEVLFFGFFKQALAADPHANWADETKGKTQLIKAVLAPRIGKAQAPAEAVPTGKLTRAQVVQEFEAHRGEIEPFVRESTLPIKEHTFVDFIPVMGTLNGYQWLLYVPLHTERHDKQIAAIKDTSGYPQ